MSKLVLTKNTYGAIKRINGVKPLPTISGFLSSEYTLENTSYAACNYYAICGISGYVVHTISGEPDEEHLEEFDVSDKETAIIYCNKMLGALEETLRLPLIKTSKLIKRYYKMLDRLEELHPGIAEEILQMLEDVEDEDEEDLAYTEECRQSAIHETRMSFCELAKEVIDDVQNALDDFASMKLPDECGETFKTGIKNYMNHRFCDIATRIYDRFRCDEEARNEVLAFVVDFVNSYNRIPGFEKINIEFAA